MINTLEQRIVKARNELKAQKVAMELAYSSVLWPENAATASWSGSLTLSLTDGVVARFRVRFTRTDGGEGAPMVNFAQEIAFSPTYAEYMATQSATMSGNDVDYPDDQEYTAYVVAAGDDYVDYYIDFTWDMLSNYYTLSSVTATISVQAISMVEGTLTITRLI